MYRCRLLMRIVSIICIESTRIAADRVNIRSWHISVTKGRLTVYLGFALALAPWLLVVISQHGVVAKLTSGVPINFLVPRMPPVSILPELLIPRSQARSIKS